MLAMSAEDSATVFMSAGRTYAKNSLDALWISSFPTASVSLSLEVLLRKPEQVYWTELRKSYKPLVNRAKREFAFRVVTGNSEDSVSILARLHASAAGRSVYEDDFWHTVSSQVDSGSSACLVVSTPSRPIGAVLLQLHGDRSSYAMGAFDRELMVQRWPIGHGALWFATKWLRDHDFTSLSLGLSPAPETQSEKERGIAQFKRGFANTVVPWSAAVLHRGDE